MTHENAEVLPAFHLTERDKDVLSLTDEQYHLLTWEDLKTIISQNELEKLTRLPSQLHAYLIWSAEIKAQYGSITAFLLKKRVQWDPLPSTSEASAPTFSYENPVPFADRSDYRILMNDWPYGLAPGIKHICVWLKVRLPVDDVMGDLTDEGRKMVDRFVQETFVRGLGVGVDQVIWFKNWTGLQSIRGVDHVHVLVRDVDEEKLEGILEKPGQ